MTAHNPLRCWFAVDINVIIAMRIAVYSIGSRWSGEYRIVTEPLPPPADPQPATPIEEVEEYEPNNSTAAPAEEEQGSSEPAEPVEEPAAPGAPTPPASQVGSTPPNQSRQSSIAVKESAVSPARSYPGPDALQMMAQVEADPAGSGPGNPPPSSDGSGSEFGQEQEAGQAGGAAVELEEPQVEAAAEPEAEAQPGPEQREANDDDFVNVHLEIIEDHTVQPSLWSQLTSPITPNTRTPPLKSTLFMFALHLVFYYLVYIFTLAIHEREAWKSANGLARAMIDELWLHQRKYGRGLAAEFLSEAFTGKLERLVVGMASVLGVERQAWIMPG
ncbi:hypothetical protein B0J14DRAFT_588546 [Halenospora varia]|nr:hypothetical protein B0J14DRAFT_588546 [Halenospora varia]